MSYKSVSFGFSVEGDDVEVYLVVPQWVTTEEIMAAELDEEGDYECVCECYSMEGANLIARLLNEEEIAGHA